MSKDYMCLCRCVIIILFFFFQAEDGIRDTSVTGVQTCALPIFTPTPEKPDATNITAPHRRHMTIEEANEKALTLTDSRSEERRVGKECRSRWSQEHSKKTKDISTKLAQEASKLH